MASEQQPSASDGTREGHEVELRAGCRVMVLKTENSSMRVPHLIGSTGIITEVPQHPNTWFKVNCNDKIYTLRPSALELVEEEDDDDKPIKAKGESSSSKLKDKDTAGGGSNSRRSSTKSSSSSTPTSPSDDKSVTKTADKTAKADDDISSEKSKDGKSSNKDANTASKKSSPKLANSTGNSTASSLTSSSSSSSSVKGGKGVDADKKDSKDKDVSGVATKASSSSSPTLSSKDKTITTTKDNGPTDKSAYEKMPWDDNNDDDDDTSNSLASVDADQWLHKLVRVKSGRPDLKGKVAKVVRTGNGWVNILTSTGETAKRAYELELISNDEESQILASEYTPSWMLNNSNDASDVNTSTSTTSTKGSGKRKQSQSTSSSQSQQHGSAPTATTAATTSSTVLKPPPIDTSNTINTKDSSMNASTSNSKGVSNDDVSIHNNIGKRTTPRSNSNTSNTTVNTDTKPSSSSPSLSLKSSVKDKHNKTDDNKDKTTSTSLSSSSGTSKKAIEPNADNVKPIQHDAKCGPSSSAVKKSTNTNTKSTSATTSAIAEPKTKIEPKDVDDNSADNKHKKEIAPDGSEYTSRWKQGPDGVMYRWTKAMQAKYDREQADDYGRGNKVALPPPIESDDEDDDDDEMVMSDKKPTKRPLDHDDDAMIDDTQDSTDKKTRADDDDDAMDQDVKPRKVSKKDDKSNTTISGRGSNTVRKTTSTRIPRASAAAAASVSAAAAALSDEYEYDNDEYDDNTSPVPNSTSHNKHSFKPITSSAIKDKQPLPAWSNATNATIYTRQRDLERHPAERERDIYRHFDKDRLDRETLSQTVARRQWEVQMQRGRERPNLTYWLNQFESVAKDTNVRDDQATDLMPFDLMPLRCDLCYLEKHNGDKYCWNVDCIASPVYKVYIQPVDGSIDPKPWEIFIKNTYQKASIKSHETPNNSASDTTTNTNDNNMSIDNKVGIIKQETKPAIVTNSKELKEASDMDVTNDIKTTTTDDNNDEVDKKIDVPRTRANASQSQRSYVYDNNNDSNESKHSNTPYINSFKRHTRINEVITYVLQAPVKWLDSRKRARISYEKFNNNNDDGLWYRWNCYAVSHETIPITNTLDEIRDTYYCVDKNDKIDEKAYWQAITGKRKSFTQRISPNNAQAMMHMNSNNPNNRGLPPHLIINTSSNNNMMQQPRNKRIMKSPNGSNGMNNMQSSLSSMNNNNNMNMSHMYHNMNNNHIRPLHPPMHSNEITRQTIYGSQLNMQHPANRHLIGTHLDPLMRGIPSATPAALPSSILPARPRTHNTTTALAAAMNAAHQAAVASGQHSSIVGNLNINQNHSGQRAQSPQQPQPQPHWRNIAPISNNNSNNINSNTNTSQFSGVHGNNPNNMGNNPNNNVVLPSSAVSNNNSINNTFVRSNQHQSTIPSSSHSNVNEHHQSHSNQHMLHGNSNNNNMNSVNVNSMNRSTSASQLSHHHQSSNNVSNNASNTNNMNQPSHVNSSFTNQPLGPPRVSSSSSQQQVGDNINRSTMVRPQQQQQQQQRRSVPANMAVEHVEFDHKYARDHGLTGNFDRSHPQYIQQRQQFERQQQQQQQQQQQMQQQQQHVNNNEMTPLFTINNGGSISYLYASKPPQSQLMQKPQQQQQPLRSSASSMPSDIVAAAQLQSIKPSSSHSPQHKPVNTNVNVMNSSSGTFAHGPVTNSRNASNIGMSASTLANTSANISGQHQQQQHQLSPNASMSTSTSSSIPSSSSISKTDS